MKYKERTHAKRRFKKAVFVTAATMTLGMSTFGDTISVFAAENTTETQKETTTFEKNIQAIDEIHVKKGTEAIVGSGLVPSHVENFKTIAKNTHTYIFFRPVNTLSTSLIKQGASTKGLNVHGKSSNWGPMAGYIPVDQDLSKKYGNKKAVEKGNKDNEDSFAANNGLNGKDHITKIILTLNQERIEELQKEKLLAKGTEQKEDNHVYLMFDVTNSSYEFRMDKQTGQVQYKTKKGKTTTLGKELEKWTFLEVMAKVVNGDPKALTADYDLFALAPSLSEIKKRIPVSQWEKLLGIEKPVEKWKTTTQLIIKHGLTRENKEDGKGTLTDWQRDMIAILNQAAIDSGYTGGTVINHGTEQDNTEFPEQDQEVFVITPNGETFLTKSWEDTQNFIAKNVIQEGYLFYQNRSYNTIAPGSKAQIQWNGSIPTSVEFVQELSKIRAATNNTELNETVTTAYTQEIMELLKQYYNPATQFLKQERKQQEEVSLFRGIQLLEKVDQLLNNVSLPNQEYQTYFEMLKKRITNQVQLIRKSQNIKISIESLQEKLNLNNTNIDEVFATFHVLIK
ncbi:CyaA/EF/ExoY family adenylyl cyclase toxin [Bacillus sp. FDAARGOS_1420]|uniref:CyaA/EF/ExoY family adenylyl cyclase toxin n=1 Tax=unclassified Bacillus (in: firmicutes) TaxID=185979 RepID=UPI001C5B74D1|nr:CyaA/EF/ExoY family adenylyl cyclase toxin [Bacillus sp. FDAARGOS_1420]MBW3496817.1 CyaA/EF/ExoY family adenylyl cyclase toxin [Bacillus sp. FDAARGOS_1420]